MCDFDLRLILFKISGLVIVFLIFFILRFIFAPTKSFKDFFVGDLGSYSLARLQMVVWVYVIISFQCTVLIATLKHGFDKIYLFDIVLSEEILWLIGISSTGYIAVKGIVTNKIANNTQGPIKVRNWADLIVGENGLDFSKFQFLTWTIIAVYVYLLHCNDYINALLYSRDEDVSKILSDSSKIPTVSWSFIVLMGLSQGTYIGKKLIPVHKAEEFKIEKLITQADLLSDVEAEIEAKELLALNKPITEVGKAQARTLKAELEELKTKRRRLQAEVDRL